MPREQHAGLAINWEEFGQGAPMAFLHCAQGALGTLKGLAADFQGQHRCLLVDSPGHGGSEYDPEQDYQLQAVRALLPLLEQAEAPVILFGHSYGGTIAIRIAHMRPELVRALIVYEPPSFGFLHDAKHPFIEKSDPSALSELEGLTEAFDAENWPEAARIFYSFWEAERSWESLAPQSREYLTKTVKFIRIQHSSLYGTPQERLMLSDLGDVSAPTLVMHGSETREVAKATMEVMAQALPNASAQVLAGGDHMSPIKQASALAAVAQRWLNSLPVSE